MQDQCTEKSKTIKKTIKALLYNFFCSAATFFHELDNMETERYNGIKNCFNLNALY